jgi:acetyl-CoA carboxylase biotin carboxyl carrier protein
LKLSRIGEEIMPEKRELKLEILKEIIQIMKDEDISEVCIQQNDLKIKVKRLPDQMSLATQGAAMMAPQQEVARSEDISDGLVIIPAPMVGTFYRAPSPDAKPYINVGDEIEAGEVICVIEAMKLMNEITADVNGEVVGIMVEDGQPVEYDQPMFQVRPR